MLPEVDAPESHSEIPANLDRRWHFLAGGLPLPPTTTRVNIGTTRNYSPNKTCQRIVSAHGRDVQKLVRDKRDAAGLMAVGAEAMSFGIKAFLQPGRK